MLKRCSSKFPLLVAHALRFSTWRDLPDCNVYHWADCNEVNKKGVMSLAKAKVIPRINRDNRDFLWK